MVIALEITINVCRFAQKPRSRAVRSDNFNFRKKDRFFFYKMGLLDSLCVFWCCRAEARAGSFFWGGGGGRGEFNPLNVS
jgi:hypothetical protein